MDLSIVIVNYNVKYFIEQCLHSVAKAIKNIKAEVFVVDNNSVDGSCAMIKEKFPWVKLIENKENKGFSKANNQALKLSKAKYSLLLNPDTVVEEDTFRKCVQFMDDHPEAGGLGVKMIDGKGNFLPESKRSLPTPLISFYKIFGLSKIFPKSRIFGKYHLSYLDKNKPHEIEILAGAFMLLRNETLKKTGLLDETYFMYGEDIDLSYRIMKAGYKNYYFPETTIIHYKGESTKKGSINYVIVFYKAMIIFAKKHFSKKNAHIFSILINLAIYFRASLAITRRFIKKIYQPLIDFILIFAGFYLLTPIWENFKFGTDNYYPPEYLRYIVPSYIIIWLITLYYSGAYEKPVRIWNIFKGHMTGTMIILILYALLPISLRFSRALILLGSIWVLIALLIHRLSFNLLKIKDYEFSANRKKRIIVAGKPKEAERVTDILSKTRIRPDIIGLVNPGKRDNAGQYLGNLDQLSEIVHIHKIDEVIFCSKDITATVIINKMANLADFPIEFKIAPPESISVIGSNSINTAGDLYLIHFNSIAKEKNRRQKRLFDILTSLFFILFTPVLPFFLKKYKKLLTNSFNVIIGKNTWIGYCKSVDYSTLPQIRDGVFSLCNGKKNVKEKYILEKLNIDYAKNYKISNDFHLLWKEILLLRIR